jgi:hypothetical protein
MILRTLLVASAALLDLAYAQFDLNFPPPRGTNEATMGTAPCGGFDKPSSDRTRTNINSMYLDITYPGNEIGLEIRMGLGASPADFNVTILSEWEAAIYLANGSFVADGIFLPDNIGLSEGVDATIQVIATTGNPSTDKRYAVRKS